MTAVAARASRLVLPKRIKAFYGAGSIANGAYGALGGLAMFFYNQVVGVPVATAAAAISAVVLVDAFWDMVIAHTSDQFRSKLGRRHPFILAALLVLPVAIYLRWHPPAGWAPEQMFYYILGTGLFLNLIWSFYEIPTSALAAELAPEYDDRTVLLSWRWVLQALGTAIATALIYGVFLRATPNHPVGQLNRDGYGPLSLAIIAVVVTAGLAMALGTSRRIPTFFQPEARAAFSLRNQFDNFAGAVKNRNFLVVMVSGIVSGLSSGIAGGFDLYFKTFFWELKSQDILILGLLGLPFPIIAGFITPVLARRWTKRRAMLTLFFISVIFSQGPMLLRLLGILDLNGSPMLLWVLGAAGLVAGVASMGGYIAVSSMIIDIVEDVQVKTGHRAEALIATADSFPQKMVAAASALIPGLILTFVAFPRQATPGPEAMALITHAAWIYLPIVTLFSAGSVAILALYRLEKSDHERNLAALGR